MPKQPHPHLEEQKSNRSVNGCLLNCMSLPPGKQRSPQANAQKYHTGYRADVEQIMVFRLPDESHRSYCALAVSLQPFGLNKAGELR